MAEDISARVAWALKKALTPKDAAATSGSGTATFVRRDESGVGWVRIPGNDFDTPVAGGIVAEAQPGDTVTYNIENNGVTITGNSTSPSVGGRFVGEALAPVRKAVSGLGGRVAASLNIAEAAQAVASAINQHFWHDSNGIHVTEVTQEAWQAAQTGANVLINSVGQLFRDGSDNLLTLTTENGARALTIWDGLGNTASNILARFSSDGISFADGTSFDIGDSSSYIHFDGNGHINIGGSGLTIGGSTTLAELLAKYDATITSDDISVSKTGGTATITVGGDSVTISDGATGAQGPKGDQGEKGETGETGPQGPAGHSPAITTSKNSDGSVTIYVDGTATSTVDAGEDGQTPTITTTKNSDGSVTIYVNGTASNTVEAGADGTSYYTYVRYSANANGSGMVATPTSATKYIGVYTGTSSSVPAYTSFKWSKYVGEDGSDADPLTVTSHAVDYQLSTSGTTAPTGTWSTTPLAPTTTQYLWTRTTLKFSDNTESVSYSVGGKAGTNGQNGTNGANGMDGGRWYAGTKITGTSTTATVFSGSGIAAAVVGDMYLNTSTYNTYRCTVAGNASTAKWVYTANIKGQTGAQGPQGETGPQGPQGPQGETGSAGTNGVSVTGVEHQYYLSTSSTSQTGGSWAVKPAAYVKGRYYWERWKVSFSSGNPTYTTATLAEEVTSAWAAIEQNDEQITLKANSSDVYTKTQTDGLISTEVTNRNAAITAKANEITSSVSETYATKSSVNGKADASDVTALAGRVTTAETNITQNANNIALKVSESDVTGNYLIGKINLDSTTASIAAQRINLQGAVTISDLSSDAQSATLNSNISVGGRNLLTGTADYSTKSTANQTGITVSSDTFGGTKVLVGTWSRGNMDMGRFANAFSISLRPDSDYTLSFWAKATAAVSVISYLFTPSTVVSGENSSGNTTTMSDGTITTTLSTEWERYWVTWHTSTAASQATQVIAARVGASASGQTIYLAGVKFEQGNTATDWSPAPEDVDNAISNAAKTATSYVTEITGQNGIMVHPSTDDDTGVRVTSDVDIMRNGNSILNVGTQGDTTSTDAGVTIYDGEGNDSSNIIARLLGTGAQIGRDADIHVSIDGNSLDVLKGTNNRQLITMRDSGDAGYVGATYFDEDGYEHHGAGAIVEADTDGSRMIVEINTEYNYSDIDINNFNGRTDMNINGMKTIRFSDPYDSSLSTYLQLGDPTRYQNSGSYAITTAGIDTYTNGPRITIPAGSYMFVGAWTFNSASASGDRNMQVGFRSGASGTLWGERVRIRQSSGNFAVLNVSALRVFDSETTVYLAGSASITSGAGDAWITAVRLN